VRPRTRCERSELLLANRAGAGCLWQLGCLCPAETPLLCAPPSPAVCPLQRFWPLWLARTVPSCKGCHINCSPDDLGEVLNCVLQETSQYAILQAQQTQQTQQTQQVINSLLTRGGSRCRELAQQPVNRSSTFVARRDDVLELCWLNEAEVLH